MLPLKLKVYIEEDERKIVNFNEDQWEEVCIIYEKLVRNLKEEMKDIKIENFDKSKSPYITMEIDIDENIDEEKLVYIASYLSGNETENPVYFTDEDCYLTGSNIVIEKTNILDRYNQILSDIGV